MAPTALEKSCCWLISQCSSPEAQGDSGGISLQRACANSFWEIPLAPCHLGISPPLCCSNSSATADVSSLMTNCARQESPSRSDSSVVHVAAAWELLLFHHVVFCLVLQSPAGSVAFTGGLNGCAVAVIMFFKTSVSSSCCSMTDVPLQCMCRVPNVPSVRLF